MDACNRSCRSGPRYPIRSHNTWGQSCGAMYRLRDQHRGLANMSQNVLNNPSSGIEQESGVHSADADSVFGWRLCVPLPAACTADRRLGVGPVRRTQGLSAASCQLAYLSGAVGHTRLLAGRTGHVASAPGLHRTAGPRLPTEHRRSGHSGHDRAAQTPDDPRTGQRMDDRLGRRGGDLDTCCRHTAQAVGPCRTLDRRSTHLGGPDRRRLLF